MSEGLRVFRSVAMYLRTAEERRDLLKRYGLALALACLALLLRRSLPVREGTAVYQLPLVAVVLARLVRRTRARPVRLADLLDRGRCTGSSLPWIRSSLSSEYQLGFVHLHRAVPVPHRIRRESVARRARAGGERAAFPAHGRDHPGNPLDRIHHAAAHAVHEPQVRADLGTPARRCRARPGSLDRGGPSGAQERRAIRVETLAGGRRRRAARHDLPHRPARRRHTLDPQPRHLDPRRAGKALPRQRHRRGHHRRKARAGGARQGADGARARVAADDAGRADHLDRPRGQPAAGGNDGQRGRRRALARRRAARHRGSAGGPRQHRRRRQARARGHRAHPRPHQAPGTAQGPRGHQPRDPGGPRAHGAGVAQPRHRRSDTARQVAAARRRATGCSCSRCCSTWS